MPTLRAYRSAPVLLAFSLVLTAATPLVRHACTMQGMETMTKPCCKGKAERHGAPTMHGDMARSDMAGMPCHAAQISDTPEAPCSEAPDGLDLRAACCANVEAPAAPAPERVELLPASVAAFIAAMLAPPVETHPPPTHPPGDPPPPAPVALHLLYGSFLT